MNKSWKWIKKLKKGFIISLLCASSSLAIIQAAPAATQLVVDSNTLNVRGGPGTNHNIVTQIQKGDQFIALDTRGDWYKININGTEGWVAGWLVNTKQIADASGRNAVVKADTLNVRGGPGTSYTVVGKVKAGDKLPVLTSSGDWLKVQLPNGIVGWVAGWLVEIKQSTSGTQPTAQQQPTNTDKVKQATITASTLNVRSGPGTSNGIVAKVNKSEKYNIIDVQGQWLKISLAGGKSGWIASWLANVSEVTVAKQTPPTNAQPPTQQSPTNTDKIKQATITASTLNVRSGPGTSNGIVAKVNNGEKYNIIGVQGQWLKISLAEGKIGWIASWFADVSEIAAAKPTPPEQNSNQNDSVLAAVINDNLVNVRGGPGTQHGVISQVSRGQRLGILESAGDWYKVKLDGGVAGWVAGWLINVETAEASPSPGDPPVVTDDTDQSQEQPPEELVRLEKIEVREGQGHTYVTIKANNKLNYDMFMITNPERLVIDLKYTSLDDLPEKIEVNSDAVSQLRTGPFSKEPPVVRLVFDLKKAVIAVDKLSDDRTQLNLDIFIPEIGSFLKDRVIAIDAGHGGKDPGAKGPTGLQEKDVNLDIALKLAKILTDNGAKVIMTRTDDTFVDLYERTAIAERNGAEVFLSIHINANPSSDKNGTSTYYRRDTGDVAPGVDQADNRRLAGAIQSELLRELSRRSLGVLQANFVVLRTSPVPAALAEIAFVSNPQEEAMLRQESFRTKTAQALAQALNNYFSPTN